MPKLTRAQRAVMRRLEAGGQIWAVSSAEEPTDDPNVSFVVAVFDNGEFIGTENVQVRTLVRLRSLGLIPEDAIF